jgi:hypothetical protein
VNRIPVVILTTVLLLVPAAADPVKITTVRDDDINECSGIAASYQNSDTLWMHNDSGDKPNLYLVDMKNGRTRAVVRVKGAANYDWEDMASFVLDGSSWLLIGDVGDNGRRRGKDNSDSCRLYLVKEPEIQAAKKPQRLDVTVWAKIEFQYEDGRFDCEGVAVDTERREILLLTKELFGRCGLYILPLDLRTQRQTHTARRIASPFLPLATALDVAPSGRHMIIGTLTSGLLMTREGDESWSDAFARPASPLKMPPRKQGESACFDRRKKCIYVNSEFKHQPLWRVEYPERASFPSSLKDRQ